MTVKRPVITFAPVTGPVERVRPVLKFDVPEEAPEVPGVQDREVSGVDLMDLVRVCRNEEI